MSNAYLANPSSLILYVMRIQQTHYPNIRFVGEVAYALLNICLNRGFESEQRKTVSGTVVAGS